MAGLGLCTLLDHKLWLLRYVDCGEADTSLSQSCLLTELVEVDTAVLEANIGYSWPMTPDRTGKN